MSAEFVPGYSDLELLEKRAARERKARREAERILEDKSRDLYQVNSALKNAQAELERKIRALEIERDRIVQMSCTDLLTGLPNRSALLTTLEQRLSSYREDVWLFLLNIQHFQFVNASLGQRGGDDVLKAMGARLAEIAKNYSGFAARISGTEFAFVLECSASDIDVLADELRLKLERPIKHKDRDVFIDVAMAVAGTNLVEPTSEKLRLAADFALAEGRAVGDWTLSWFDAEMQAKVQRRQMLLGQLHGAIERGEIEAWFQPIVSPSDDSKLSLEVLARWRERGVLVSPTEFFPLVDELGMRDNLERTLLRSALKIAKPWVDAGRVQDISLNVSPQNLVTQGFAAEFEQHLKEADFPPECLIVELTEETFIENLEAVREQLFELQAIGVRIALDDFGTGYSNLRSLVGLPLSKIKLDRSLIWEMETSDRIVMLVSTLIQWARASDLQVVAEGVETEIQAMLLRSLGCNNLQGYLYSRALPARLLAPRFDLEPETEPAEEAW